MLHKLCIFSETTKKKARNLQVISQLPQHQHFNNPIHLSPGGPIPHNMARALIIASSSPPHAVPSRITWRRPLMVRQP